MKSHQRYKESSTPSRLWGHGSMPDRLHGSYIPSKNTPPKTKMIMENTTIFYRKYQIPLQMVVFPMSCWFAGEHPIESCIMSVVRTIFWTFFLEVRSIWGLSLKTYDNIGWAKVYTPLLDST